MTDEQRQEIMHRQAEGTRAMSNEEMARRQLTAAEGMQRGPLTSGEQDAMRNFCGGTADERNAFIPDPPAPTRWARFMRWLRA